MKDLLRCRSGVAAVPGPWRDGPAGPETRRDPAQPEPDPGVAGIWGGRVGCWHHAQVEVTC